MNTLPPMPAPETPHTKESSHTVIAAMVASGVYTDDDIAQVAGVAPQYVATLRGSPLFQALVNGFREKFADRAIDRVLDDIFKDTRANFEWLRGMRGDQYDDDPKMRRLQLRAAEILFDRQVPKRAEKLADPTRALGEAVVERLTRAAAADAAIDVTPSDDGR